MNKIILFLLTVFVALPFAQNHSYLQVEIGSQTWMAENSMEYADDSWCMGNDEQTCLYGRFYTWEAAKNACPEGWHLPSSDEWVTLLDYAEGESDSASYAELLRYESGWEDYDRDLDYDEEGEVKPSKPIKQGRNLYGFSIKPLGYVESASREAYYYDNYDSYGENHSKFFRDFGQRAYFWTKDGDAVRFRSDNDVSVQSYDGDYGFNVRCVKGEPVQEASYKETPAESETEPLIPSYSVSSSSETAYHQTYDYSYSSSSESAGYAYQQDEEEEAAYVDEVEHEADPSEGEVYGLENFCEVGDCGNDNSRDKVAVGQSVDTGIEEPTKITTYVGVGFISASVLSIFVGVIYSLAADDAEKDMANATNPYEYQIAIDARDDRKSSSQKWSLIGLGLAAAGFTFILAF